jgi:hypothetical protein
MNFRLLKHVNIFASFTNSWLNGLSYYFKQLKSIFITISDFSEYADLNSPKSPSTVLWKPLIYDKNPNFDRILLLIIKFKMNVFFNISLIYLYIFYLLLFNF